MTDELQNALDLQRQAFLRDGFPTLEVRLDRLDRLSKALITFQDKLLQALQDDFGGRSPFSGISGDILGSLKSLDYTRQHLSSWMAAAEVSLPPEVVASGVRAEVLPLPLGVVGAIIPWNGPVLMTFSALAGIIGAGNRAMVKVSDSTLNTARAIAEALASQFSPEEIFCAGSGAGMSAKFSRLKFDHLLFTGSTATGKKIMSAAAENLVPVTLELGGKCPAILGKTANVEEAAARIAVGKLAGAGQVCVATDYVYVPKGKKDEFVSAILAAAPKLYPDILNNPEYTSVIDEGNRDRIRHVVKDAREKGATLTEMSGTSLDDAKGTRLPLVVATNVSDDMEIMQEEIFGPLIAVMEYDQLSDAIAYIARQPHPLTASYFGTDDAEIQMFLREVQSGGAVINDVRIQLFHEALPFGGVGASGIGRYRGYEGFRTFSNMKTVVHQSAREEVLAAQRPPFSKDSYAFMERAIKNFAAV